MRQVTGVRAPHWDQAAALPPQFQIGHSYLTPVETVLDAKTWFADVVHTEIGPLLHEYWFDAPERAKQATQNLLLQA